jgi:hypothetical protein
MEIKMDLNNFDKVVQNMDDLGKRQLPFALASSLTQTAKDIQAKELEILPTMFTLRTKWYQPKTKYGINVDPATKGNLKARVFSDADWLALQEQGGEKIPHKGRVMLAMPSTNVRRSKSGIIPPAMRPRALLSGYYIKRGRGKTGGGKVILAGGVNGAFIGPMRSGKPAIFQRVGKGLKLMYTLQPTAPITPRAFFFKVGRIQAGMFPVNFWNAFAEARRTVR